MIMADIRISLNGNPMGKSLSWIPYFLDKQMLTESEMYIEVGNQLTNYLGTIGMFQLQTFNFILDFTISRFFDCNPLSILGPMKMIKTV